MHIYIYIACDRYMLAPENICSHRNYNFKEVADSLLLFLFSRGIPYDAVIQDLVL